MSSEVINRSVQEWRSKARLGELTVPEMKAALAAIRDERLKAGAVSAKSKTVADGSAPAKPRTTKKAIAAVDSDKLLDDLMGI